MLATTPNVASIPNLDGLLAYFLANFLFRYGIKANCDFQNWAEKNPDISIFKEGHSLLTFHNLEPKLEKAAHEQTIAFIISWLQQWQLTEGTWSIDPDIFYWKYNRQAIHILD